MITWDGQVLLLRVVAVLLLAMEGGCMITWGG